MPFIGGRYYANALAGHAIEAAREVEAAALALKKKSAQRGNRSVSASGNARADSGETGGDEDTSSESMQPEDAPIHRVEIEAAELVPSHTGRAQRGFVARVHRDPELAGDAMSNANVSRAPMPGQLPSHGYTLKPETHVFAGHNDLLDFLKTELGKKCSS
jgi:hypothetical protein